MRYDGPGFYGLNPPPWVSGAAQQPAGQWVTSPADKEIYQRIAATNSSTTDPADDTTNYVARSYVRTAAIVGGGLISGVGAFTNIGFGSTKTNLAAIGVGTRTNILSVTGRGGIDYFAFFKGAAGTTRIEIIVDGRTVFDQTNTFTTTNALLALGEIRPDSSGTFTLYAATFDAQGIKFRRSLEVFLTNTATASTTSAGIAYHLQSEA